MTRAARGSLLHEADGDFNPGWLLVLAFALIGAAGCLVALVLAFRAEAAASVLIAIALGFVAFMVIVASTMVLSIARVKALHDSALLRTLAPGAARAEARAPSAPTSFASPVAPRLGAHPPIESEEEGLG